MGRLVADASPALLFAASRVTIVVVAVTLPSFLHWLILRRWFSRAGWWVLASTVGSLLGFIPLGLALAVADTHGDTVFARIAAPAAIALAGAVAGVVRWLVLRRWVSRAGWWILASTISWFGVTFAFMSLTRGADVHLFLGGSVSGALSGVITGLALVWLIWGT